MDDSAELRTPPLNKIGLPDLRQRMADWLMHAKGNRRRAFEYRRWAKEYEAAGNLPKYRRYRDQSDRSWRLAWNALREARLNKELLNV